MPIPLPVPDEAQARPRPAQDSTKAFDLSCAAIGAAAIGLAVFIDQLCYDRSGAVLVLVLAGGLIAALMHGSCISQSE